MAASCPLRAFRILGALALAGVAALPLAAGGQALGQLPGQSRLQQQLGLAINTTVCPGLQNAGVGDDDGTPQGDLLGRCNDLVATATVISDGDPNEPGGPLDLNAAGVNASLDTLANTQLPAIGRGASEVTLLQAGAIGERLYALREGATGVQVAGHAYDPEGRRVDFDTALLDTGAAGADDAIAGSGFGVFLNTRGGFGDRSGSSEELGFDFYDVGATLGVDYRFSEQLFGGIAGGYTYADRDFDRSGGDIESDSASAWLYGGFQEGGFFVDALYGYSHHWIDSDRTVVILSGPAVPPGSGAFRSAKGETDADEHQVAGSAGYLFELNGFGVGPITRLEYVHLDVDGFTESGAGGLDLIHDDDTIESLIFNLGAEVSYDFSTDFGVVTPLLRAEWAHQFKDDSRNVNARFLYDPTNTGFFVRTRSPDRDYVDLGASVAAQLGGGLALILTYDTLLGHSDVDVHAFTLGGRMEF